MARERPAPARKPAPAKPTDTQRINPIEGRLWDTYWRRRYVHDVYAVACAVAQVDRAIRRRNA